MKTYLFLNIATGRKAKVTEQGKASYEAHAELSKTMKLLGECDANFNLIVVEQTEVEEVFDLDEIQESKEIVTEKSDFIEPKKTKKVK